MLMLYIVWGDMVAIHLVCKKTCSGCSFHINVEQLIEHMHLVKISIKYVRTYIEKKYHASIAQITSKPMIVSHTDKTVELRNVCTFISYLL